MNMKLAAKIMGKVGLVGFIGFVATFTIYMFNLENKLIYYVLRPFLNKHYDSHCTPKAPNAHVCEPSGIFSVVHAAREND